MKKGCAMHSLNDFTFELQILLCQSPWYCHISIEVLKKKKMLLWVWTKISKAKKSELTPNFKDKASGGATSWCRSLLAAGSASSSYRMPCAHKKGVLQGFRKCQVHSMAEKMGFYTSLYFYFHVWIKGFFSFFIFFFLIDAFAIFLFIFWFSWLVSSK